MANRSALALSLLPAMLLAAACARAPEMSPPGATSEPIILPTVEPRAWVLNVGDQDFQIYDAGTGQHVVSSLPFLWRPSVDLTHDSGLSSAGLLAVRTATSRHLPEDISLAIIRLQDGETLAHIPLLSDRLQIHMAEDSGFTDRYGVKQDVYAAVLDRSVAPRWSPDGRSVAFGAAIDGSSTDVYVYDVESAALNRLTDQNEQVVVLGWSPDGEWVVYGSAYGFDEEYLDYLMDSFWAVSPRTGEVRELGLSEYGLPAEIVGWLSSTEFAMVDIDPGFGYWDLSTIDINTQEFTITPTPLMRSTAYDPASGVFAFAVADDWLLEAEDFELEPSEAEEFLGELGLFLVAPGSEARELAEASVNELWSVVRWVPELELFFAASDQSVIAFSREGAIRHTYIHERCVPNASPDGRWLAFGSCTSEFKSAPGLRIYDAGGALINELETNYIEELVWMPDSSGLYYTMYPGSGVQLNSVDLSEEEPVVIDPDSPVGLALIEVASPDLESISMAPTAAPQPTGELGPPPTEIVPTPQRLLSENGPWLVGFSGDGFVALNPDGTGRTEVRLVGEEFVKNTAISPAGWLAQIVEEVAAIPQIRITRLPDKQPFHVVPLMTEEIAADRDELGSDGQPKEWTEDVHLALNAYGFMNPMLWSPDGQHLAFVAATDGPSADVYVFDGVEGKIRRLTSGPNQPYLLGWSDDGKWILHLEIKNINAGDGVWWDTVALWAAAADGSAVKKVPGIDEDVYLVNWSKPDEFVVVHDTYGPLPPFQFELVNLNTGPIRTLYPHYVTRWAVDPETQTFAFYVDEYRSRTDEPLTEGLYLVSPDRPTIEEVTRTEFNEESFIFHPTQPIWSPELSAFMVPAADGNTWLLTPEGELTVSIEGACSPPLPSPDGLWLAYEECFAWPEEFRLVSIDQEQVIFTSTDPFAEFFWAPDSSGLYYLAGEGPAALRFVSVPDGSDWLIHPDPGFQGGYWLPEWASRP